VALSGLERLLETAEGVRADTNLESWMDDFQIVGAAMLKLHEALCGM